MGVALVDDTSHCCFFLMPHTHTLYHNSGARRPLCLPQSGKDNPLIYASKKNKRHWFNGTKRVSHSVLRAGTPAPKGNSLSLSHYE